MVQPKVIHQGLVAFSLAAFLAVAGADLALAKASGDTPAEIPPSSYRGTQYVDSNGCVFVRAGSGGNVTWIPRVLRDRTPVCGYVPTFTQAEREAALPVIPDAPGTAAAPAAAPAKPVAAKTQPMPTVAQTTAAPAYVPKATLVVPKTAVAAPVAGVVPGVAPPAPVAPVAAPVAAPAAKPAPIVLPPDCSKLSPLAQQLMANKKNHAVRCGPQTIHPSDTVSMRVPAGTTVTTASGKTYVTRADAVMKVPAAAAESIAYTLLGAEADPLGTRLTPPAGFKSVFTDGRLNPDRGIQTARGTAMMQAVWTDTVPAKLISGHSPAAAKPFAQPLIAFAEVPAGATPVATGIDIGADAGASSGPGPRPGDTGPSDTVVATKGAAPGKTAVTPVALAPVDWRYVQVGMFGVPANAAAAIDRLRGHGWAISRANYTTGGKVLQVVLAGPFNDAASSSAALANLRAMGFNDAFQRK